MADSNDPGPDDDELVADFKPRRKGTVSLSLTFLGVGLAAYLLFDNRTDFTYWLSTPVPVELGSSDGELKAERLADNVYATVRGTPGPVADRFKYWGSTYEFVALKGSCILVRRAPHAAGELPVPPGKAPAGPDQSSFQASGRLLRDTSLPSYAHAFQTLAGRGEAVPRADHLWVLLDGQVPRTGFETPGLFALIAFVFAFNAVALVRYYRRRARDGDQG
jgi:hypothetical protein